MYVMAHSSITDANAENALFEKGTEAAFVKSGSCENTPPRSIHGRCPGVQGLEFDTCQKKAESWISGAFPEMMRDQRDVCKPSNGKRRHLFRLCIECSLQLRQNGGLDAKKLLRSSSGLVR